MLKKLENEQQKRHQFQVRQFGAEGVGIDKWGLLQKKLKEENNLITKTFFSLSATILAIFSFFSGPNEFNHLYNTNPSNFLLAHLV